MKRAATIAFLAGLLPVFAVHAAYLINIFCGSELNDQFVCWPYFEGCVSVSRAARSGPGLVLFKAVMLPCVVLLMLTWVNTRSWLNERQLFSPGYARTVMLLGGLGAVFLVLYVTALGSEGEWYRWMRRYGVTIYFGGTALAQLLLVRILWPRRVYLARGRIFQPTILLTAQLCLQWSLGLLTVAKRLLIGNAELADRIENISEWWFALLISTAFITIAWMFRRIPVGRQPATGT